MKISIVAKSALSFLMASLLLITSACSVSNTQLLDAAVAAADATVAVLATTNNIPPQDEAYVNAVLDGLNFATQELGSQKTSVQIAVDIVNQFKAVEVPDLTGLTPAQARQMQALAAAVAAFLVPFEQLAAANPAPVAAAVRAEHNDRPKLTLAVRIHLFETRHKIAAIEKRAAHVFANLAK